MASRDKVSSSSFSSNLSPSFSIFSLSSCFISILINISIFIFCLQSAIQSVEAVRTSSIQSAGQEFYLNGQTSQKLMQTPKDIERNGRGEGINTRGRGERTRNATRTIPALPIQLSAAYKEPDAGPVDQVNGTSINGANGISQVWAMWLKRIQDMNRPEVRTRIADTFAKLFRQYFLNNGTNGQFSGQKIGQPPSGQLNDQPPGGRSGSQKTELNQSESRRRQSAPQLDAGPINPFGLGGFGEQGLGAGGAPGLDFFMRVISFKRALFSQLISAGAFQSPGLLRRANGNGNGPQYGENFGGQFSNRGPFGAGQFSNGNGQFFNGNGQFSNGNGQYGGSRVQFEPLKRAASGQARIRYAPRTTTQAHEVEAT